MTTQTGVFLDHATQNLETGRFERVLEGAVVDYGGNVLFSGHPYACVKRKSGFRIPTQLRPTKTEAVEGDVVGANYTW
jgi:hypothetical protein